MPHEPQWFGSFFKLTQVPPQSVMYGLLMGQPHSPSPQTSGAEHVVPQAPQLLESKFASMQTPPQLIVPIPWPHDVSH
jgi:hypothetical protein